MLVIRLGRVGRKNVKVFRLIVSEKGRSPKRAAQEIIGYYHPTTAEPNFEYDKVRLEALIANGAQPSETVARLLKKAGAAGMEKFFDTKKVYAQKSKKKEEKA